MYEVKWVKLLKNGKSKICGRQPLKNVTWSIWFTRMGEGGRNYV